jgi:hypothetical protein
LADNECKETEMKYRTHLKESESAEVCAQMIEILHKQGIESAQAWLADVRKNDHYDFIEREYLRSRKIIYIN